MPDVFINPYDTSGYTLALMTEAIKKLPNAYGRVGQLGLFDRKGVPLRVLIVEEKEGVITVLPPTPRGAPATFGSSVKGKMRSFVIPAIKYDDFISVGDIEGRRMFGTTNNQETLANLMMEKLATMRANHDQTLEWYELNALKGTLKSGLDGSTIYNWHTEFGISKKTVDFLLGTASTNIGAKCREVKRHMEVNLKGESMTSVRALVDPNFFDKFVNHPEVKAAYQIFASNGGINPGRDDLRGGFLHGGIFWEEYNATVSLADGTSAALIDANDGVAFPMGTRQTFQTRFGPGEFFGAVGTDGQQMYARQFMAEDQSGVTIKTEAHPISINRRPELVVQVMTSN